MALDGFDAKPPPGRDVFCNRTVNMRSIRAVGYDMDYTLIHYRVEEWELRAYEHIKRKLASEGWPVDHLRFDPELMVRGLVIDTELGNVVKANRFGYVKKAFHGTRPMEYEEQRRTYSRTIVDLAERRYVFLNTFFSLSEACMYAQLVDLLDERRLPAVLGYEDLYRKVQRSLDEAHMEGVLKSEIEAAPDRFVELDPETPLALLDQKHAGKKLMIITNSEWSYTRAMMAYAFDRFLPDGMTWRDLFDVAIVGARKPDFFSGRAPIFEVVSEDGLLKPSIRGLHPGGVFLGGTASQVESHLGLSGDEILYVGDHIYGDVHVSKSVLRWRTALIVRELEKEVAALDDFQPTQEQLDGLMRQKEELESRLNLLRLAQQRQKDGYGPHSGTSREAIEEEMQALRTAIFEFDGQISPLAKLAGEVGNPHWGPLMRAGNDKSHLARQVERHADLYTSRVSNFLHRTPFAYLRSPRGNLPHDPGIIPMGSDLTAGSA